MRSDEPAIADDASVARTIIAMETAALERWCKGDPSGFLEISAPDVVYFDPFQVARLDGHTTLTAYYEGLRGKVSASRYDLANALVQRVGRAAVLTFNFTSCGADESAHRWNCTEVYRWSGSRWEIIQTHWSFAEGVRE